MPFSVFTSSTQQNHMAHIAKELKDLTDRLAKEFIQIRDHERTAEIFAGNYIYDDSLPIPSKDFILLITFAILRDRRLLKELNNKTIGEGLSSVVKKFQRSSDSKAHDLASLEARRRIMTRHLYETNDTGNGSADWNSIVYNFRSGFTGNDFIVRSVCHRALELLTARAVLLSDFKSLEGLAQSTKEAYLPDSAKAPSSASRVIISEILWFLPFLEERLSWSPSKENVKFFVTHVNTKIRSQGNTWSKAWKLLPPDILKNVGKTRLTAERRNELLSLVSSYNKGD